MLSDVTARLMGGLVAGYVGFRMGETVADDRSGLTELLWRLVPPIALFLIGVAVTPYLVRFCWRFLQRQIGAPRPSTIILGTAGLFAGLIVAALLSFPLGHLPAPFGDIAPFVATVTLAAAGVAFFAGREDEIMEFVGRYAPVLQPRPAIAPAGDEHILDTSVIIDGRIAEIADTGFISGSLVVPGFVLDELRHIADSGDEFRRVRGRRGLDVLTRMQREGPLPLKVVQETGEPNGLEVDARLVRLAMERHAPIVTNDYNLDRVAQLQGVRVLNVNRLAGALKSVLAPGEELTLRVVQEGKEAGQGVGYLDDGTMAVVENGRRYINNSADIIVTRVLQTVAGRMVFAQPKPQ